MLGSHNLAAGECYTAAGLLIEDFVLHRFLDKCIYGVFLTGQLPGLCDAPVGTDAAGGTLGTVKYNLAVYDGIGSLFPFCNASAAGGTFVLMKNQFLIIMLTLRVVAPHAA